MARSPSKTAKPAAKATTASKPAAARTATAAPRATAKADAPANSDGLAVVNVPRDPTPPAGAAGTIDVGVNGKFYKVPIGSDAPVNPEVAEVLANSTHSVNTVSPAKGEAADEGSSAASTTVTGTAIRAEVPDLASADPGQPAHELSQVADADIIATSQGGSGGPVPSAAEASKAS